MAAWAAAAQAAGQERTNQQNRGQSRIMRRFQERMSNTAIQRRMEDMRLAGINPVLAARFDATTPSGAMATMQNTGAAGVSGYTSAKGISNQTAAIQQQILQSQADIRLKNAQTDQTGQQTQLLQIQQRLQDYNADIREGAAFAIQSAMSLIPQEIRGDPQAVANYVKQKLQAFVSQNSGSIKDVQTFLNNAAQIASELLQKTTDIVTSGGPKKKPQDVINKRSKQYEGSKKRFFGKPKGTFKEWWKAKYPSEYKQYMRDK